MIRSLKRRVVDSEDGMGFQDMKVDYLDADDIVKIFVKNIFSPS